VSISPVDPPVIVSKGYVVPPLAGYSQLGMILATAVGGSPSGSTPTYVARTVQVKTQKMRGSGVGLTARNKIIFSGGGSLDSFSSADGPYVSTNRHAGGKAVSNYKLADGIHVDTAHIYGSAAVGAGGSVTVASGSVGDLTWYPGHSGAQAGSTNDYASVEFFDESAPFTSGFTPVHGSYPVGGTNYGWQFGDGNYYYSGTLQFADTAIVTGHAVLYVTQACKTSGSGFIYLAPGASMQVYVGTEFNVSGSGVVNGTQKASNFGVHGLNTCTKVVISGSSAFIGTVNAPYAAFTFSGSAGAFGSFIANTITISGGAAVHYDEALDTSGNGYVVSAWNEISN